ncbi:hypothetical protein OG393_10265 [Streptomyces sp. NBC_01216]|uniref:hypothetical protein n=1 Tax=Streptomyces sp. NBC_01216 TaxID=2903778 RepID=UPI002E0FACDF|nr:hypothetical protein OG393_10265 [Streptomyces sp. NBC_01216]
MPRVVERARVGWPRALRELKDLLYEAYLAAGAPSLDTIARDVARADAEDRAITGTPSRDTVRRCLGDPALPPDRADAVSIAVVLARRAAWDEGDLAARVGRLWVEALRAEGAGRRIADYDDRLVLADLEVHPAVDAGGARETLGALPAYLSREFDTRLGEVVAAATSGRSGVAVLVGGSSTGKTRALWEAVRTLPDGWRLWHPLSPTRPDATLAHLADIAPRTVVWLNEAQHYLAPAPLGERLAASLRSLLCDPARGPVLVLATLWPEHWETLTAAPGDRHAHARLLLSGQEIDVPDAFTPADLAGLADRASADPRLAEAAEHAKDHRVTQYLAGVPVLLSRYRTARGATLALIHAAMDARRLGAGPHIPLTWLAEAAPGYLTDTEWDQSDDDWLERALAYVMAPCNGIPGILTPVRTGTPRNRRTRGAGTGTGVGARNGTRAPRGPSYRLADYLDQHGRRHRAEVIPPVDFWTSAAVHASSSDLATLGNAAWDRGLCQDAARLLRRAVVHGSPHAATALVTHLHGLHPNDHRAARWAAAHITLDDPGAVGRLLKELRRAGAEEQAAALLARDPAAHVALTNAGTVAALSRVLRSAGAEEQAAALSARDPAHTSLDDPWAVAALLNRLRKAGASEQAAALASRAAAHAAVCPWGVAALLEALRKAGACEQVAALASRAAAHVALDDARAVATLLEALREAEASEQAAALLARDPAAHVALTDADAVAALLNELLEAEASEQAAALLARDPAAHVPLVGAHGVAPFLEALRAAGSREQAAVLCARLPAAGHFGLFAEIGDHRERFRFGREPDGSAALPWAWDDLD